MRPIFVCLLASCGFSVTAAEQTDAPASVVDGAADASDAFTCVPWAALNIDPCDAALGTPAEVTLAAGTHVIDSDTGRVASNGGTPLALPGGLLAQTTGPMARMINLRSMNIETGAVVSVVGSLPTIFVVHGDVTIAGFVDASARLEGAAVSVAGPGGNDVAQCTASTGEDGDDSTGLGGGGGGGGGGYGGNGGDGADGHGAGHGTKGSKGVSAGMATLLPLRGGCAGGSGGDDTVPAADEGGRRGDGGGALEISALGSVTISGTLASNGTSGAAAGGAAPARAGGGGGGSGGALLVDGERVEVRAGAALCANGGAGGEGGQLAATSSSGAAPTCTINRALGGAQQADGGDGGDGGAGAAAGVNATGASAGASNAGGGGGGGGAGRIRVRARAEAPSIDAAAVVSPVPVTSP